MANTRRLAAIMFTDIAGYTALMQQSERLAIEIRNRHREIFNSVTEKHGGSIIQYYGDGTLSIFDSTVAAVRCASEMQLQFLQKPSIPVRIGIHTGDIVLSEEDIIGDSVNLAARIESLGVAGSVLLSGKVAEEIRSQDDLPVQLLGTFHFKNDSRQREVYALDVPGLVIPRKKDLRGKLELPRQESWMTANRRILIPLLAILLTIAGWGISNLYGREQIESLAVLPFLNRMNDPEQDYIVDGVHEALISELQRAGMPVKARLSMMQYRNTEKPMSDIARELKVEGLIEASIFRADDTIGINIRLINIKTEDLMWTQSYKIAFSNVMSLFSSVTQHIAQEIHQALTPQAEARLTQPRPIDPEAIKAYFKGQQYWYSLTPSSLESALQYFERSRDIDSTYAPAYAGIAAVWGARLQQGLVSHLEAKPVFETELAKARELGSQMPEVQFWLGTFNTWWDWDWSAAETAFKKCLELNPNYAEAHAYYSHYLCITGQGSESIPHIEKAIDLDPLNPLFQALYGMVLNFNRRYDEVITLLTQTLQQSPTDPVALSTLRTTYHLAGRHEEAIDIWKRFYTARKDTLAVTTLERGYEEGGYHLALQRLAEMLIERSEVKYVTPWQIATLYTRAGKNEEALDWLEKAYQEHDANMPYISTDPIFDDLRSAPRFQMLLDLMDLNP